MRDDIIRAWGRLLQGDRPVLSVEITRECPLTCPGCYAYSSDHLGEDVNLRQLSDFSGDTLVERFLALVDEHRPLHVSIVGGEPLVRYRELSQILPRLAGRRIHTQVVTSAVRPIPHDWMAVPNLELTPIPPKWQEGVSIVRLPIPPRKIKRAVPIASDIGAIGRRARMGINPEPTHSRLLLPGEASPVLMLMDTARVNLAEPIAVEPGLLGEHVRMVANPESTRCQQPQQAVGLLVRMLMGQLKTKVVESLASVSGPIGRHVRMVINREVILNRFR